MRNIDLAWPIFIFVLGFFAYAAYAIKNEKEWAKKNESVFQLKNLLFNTPAWWSVLSRQEHCIQFFRSDTKYDWKATCQLMPAPNMEMQNFIINKLQQEKILFDQEATDITTEENNVRIEGTATRDDEQRLYLDIYVILHKKELYYFESRSSILNGCVEGPYFEELIKSIRPYEQRA